MSKKMDRRIVVVQSGWVLLGEFTPAQGDTPAHLHNASVVRTWGTTAGLGELAINGPTPKTVLDPAGIVVFDNPQAVLFTLRCTYA